VTAPASIVFLLDVDSTLLDNDRVIAGLQRLRIAAHGGRKAMKAKQKLYEMGQSLWLDNTQP
jgi:hypothetical protein